MQNYIIGVSFIMATIFSKGATAQLTRTLSIDSQDSPEKFYFKTFEDGVVYLKGNKVAA